MPRRKRKRSGDEKIGLIMFGFLVVVILAGVIVFQIMGLSKEKNNPIPIPPEDQTNSNIEDGNESDLEENDNKDDAETENNESGEQTSEDKPKDEFEHKYYTPVLEKTKGGFSLENESYTIADMDKVNSYLEEAFEKIRQTKNVSVTELLTSESGTENRVTQQTLREIVIDYKELTSKHIVSEKINNNPPIVKEEYYSSNEGVFRSYLSDTSNFELGSKKEEKLYMFEPYSELVTKGNLLNFTEIELENRSPYHLLDTFHRVETRPQGLIVGENQDYYAFYKETEEDFFGTTYYDIQLYLFDKMTYEPIRFVIYEKQMGEKNTDYSMKEIVYSDYDNSLKVKVPKNIQTKALGIPEQ